MAEQKLTQQGDSFIGYERTTISPTKIDSANRGVFVTGCDSGFGRKIAGHLDTLGFTVFAGCLNKGGYGADLLKNGCSKNLHIVPLNVTSDNSVDDALKYVKRNLPSRGLCGIVNNAGIQYNGEIELMTLAMFQEIINVNMFGPIRIIKSFLPLIRKTKGRCVTVTSVYGRYSSPEIAAYTTSKHGLETLMDSLRMEMIKFGVKCSLVEPGFFDHATALVSEQNVKKYEVAIEKMWNMATPEVQQTYGKQHLLSWIPEALGSEVATGDASPIVNAVTHGLTSENPQSRYTVDGTYRRFYDEYAIMARLYNFLPSWFSDFVLVRWSGCGILKM